MSSLACWSEVEVFLSRKLLVKVKDTAKCILHGIYTERDLLTTLLSSSRNVKHSKTISGFWTKHCSDFAGRNGL